MNGVNDSVLYNDRGVTARVHLTTKQELNEFGLDIKVGEVKIVDRLEELENNIPNIVIAECLKNTVFIQNKFKKQTIQKKVKYVMALGVYQQLCKDPSGKIKILRPTRPIFRNIYKRYTGQDLDGKTLLVWRTGGIGDLLFIQPNLKYLKEKYDCKIIFSCGPQYRPMLENWDCVDEVTDLPFSLKYLVSADYHLLFEGVIERCKEAHYTNAYELFTRWSNINLPIEQLIPSQEPKQEMLEECSKFLIKNNISEKDFILIQLRASSPIRTPSSIDFWKPFINELTKRGRKVVITDASHKAHEVDTFINMLENKEQVFNFSEISTSVDFTIAMASKAKICISTDTALMHIAESVGTKSFGIYGPFPGGIRLSTYKHAKWVDSNAVCAPCYLHGHKPCPYSKGGYSTCYNKIDIIDTVNQIEEFINI